MYLILNWLAGICGLVIGDFTASIIIGRPETSEQNIFFMLIISGIIGLISWLANINRNK